MTKHELVVDTDQKRFRCICGYTYGIPYTLTRAGAEKEFREQLTAVKAHVEQANEQDAAFERVAAEYRLEQERR